MMLGFLSEYIRMTERPFGQDILNFHRKEQQQKLVNILRSPFSKNINFS